MKKILLLACLLSMGLQAVEYELQFENDQISIARIKVQAHEELGLHRDAYPSVVVGLQGGTITRLEANGEKTDVNFPTNVAVFREADPENELHKSVNNSSEPVEVIIIQFKNNVAFSKEA